MLTDDEWSKAFSKVLLRKLEENEMTQRDLADKSGLTEISISRYIHRKRIPNVDTLIILAKALNCKVREICDFEEHEIYDYRKEIIHLSVSDINLLSKGRAVLKLTNKNNEIMIIMNKSEEDD